MIIAEIDVYSTYVVARRNNAYVEKIAPKMSRAVNDSTNRFDNTPLPVGACGLSVQFQFMDPAWDKLSKTAVFRSKAARIDAAIVDNCAIIPHEVLANVMDVVDVGVYGTDSAQNTAIPTVWAQLGTIVSAAIPSGESSAEPTLPYWAQIKERLDTLHDEMMTQEDLELALDQAKESGEFDGPKGEKGDTGDRGETGERGYSPVKGVDYWTKAELDAVVTSVANMVSKITNTSSDIVCEAKGNTIFLADSATRELHGLIIYGKTTRNGEPAPESPVELENVGSNGRLNLSLTGSAEDSIQAISISTPNGLPGIPVTSGGSYTDENGQMWICDEIDFARGKYVKRVAQVTFDGSEVWGGDYPSKSYVYVQIPDKRNGKSNVLCDAFITIARVNEYPYIHGNDGNKNVLFQLGDNPPEGVSGVDTWKTWLASHPIEFMYELEEPIETDLSAEELAQYSALNSNYPNTTISIDGGACMAVKYVADTKNYIDNKFNELAKVIVNT